MAEYISTFVTGFGGVAAALLPRALPGARVIELYDGLIHYAYDGDYTLIKGAGCLSNTFRVLMAFKGKRAAFERMIEAAGGARYGFPIDTGTYRVRFSRENQFVKADKRLMDAARAHVEARSRLIYDGLKPSTEIWYMLRSEGVGYYCQLLFKREATEKTLNKGELRPEVAYMMCLCADLRDGAAVCDPFCGYGAIPMQLIKHFNLGRLLASDIDKARVSELKARAPRRARGAEFFVADATRLTHIEAGALDAIITDPPWGYYEQISDMRAFYARMLSEFKRVLKRESVMVVLSARKQEFADACQAAGITIAEQIDTLINGKKAAVFVAKTPRAPEGTTSLEFH